MAGRHIMRRVARVAMRLSTDAFSKAAKTIPRRVARIFIDADADAAPCEALDAANPYWDCNFDMDGGDDFNAALDDYSAPPSLDL